MKKCSNCFTLKDESEFYRKLQSFQSRCKSCNAEVVRSYNVSRRKILIKQGWDKVFGRVKAEGGAG